MHKGIILLVRAEDREGARSQVEEFLEGYGDGDVWDWYEIGGRWTGSLTGYNPTKDPRNLEKCSLCNGTGDRKDLKPKSWKKKCNGCNGCNGTGKSLKFGFVDYEEDILPADDPRAAKAIEHWAKDWLKQAKESVQQSMESFACDVGMTKYLKGKIKNLDDDQFSFESNVYDTVNNSNQPPKDLKGFWAVVCDLHN